MVPGPYVRGRQIRARVLIAAAAGALAVAAPAQAANPEIEPATGRVLVSLERGAAARTVLRGIGARQVAPPVPAIGLLTLRPGNGLTAAALVALLRHVPGVRAVSLERTMSPRLVPDDPALSVAEPAPGLPPGTVLQWPALRHNLPAAWDFARGDGAVVAVIDTGVEASHPDLAGKLVEGSSGSDADGHGTHVAALACAATGNGLGIAGAGFGCKILSLVTDFSDGDIARAIVTAADRGAHAVVMAFGDEGGEPSQPIADAIANAASRNVVLVAAAADVPTEEQGEPANLLQPTGSGADLEAGSGLSVTAASFADRRAAFAGLGTQISLAAYGTVAATEADPGPPGLFSAYPAAETPRERGSLIPLELPCRCRAGLAGDSRYAYLAGTSMAAPQVAGVAAMLRVFNPDLAAADVVRILKQTARRAADAWEPDLGWGILDAGAAVAAARTVDRRAPSSRASAPARTSRRRVRIRVSASDRAPTGLEASGVRRVSLYRARGNGRLRRVAVVSGGSIRMTLVRGATYRFASRALDRAGNSEPLPARADATVRVRR